MQAPLAQIPWYHNLALIEKLKSAEERLWYAEQTIAHGWSRNVLVLQIEGGLYHRQGRALTNFTRALPEPQSDLAQQILKDPYNFDFLTLTAEAKESELERGLLDHIRQFLLELGVGFAFVGSQFPLDVRGQDFRIDLLFYHLRLRAFIVVDLKAGPFKTRVFRQDEFLPFSSGRPSATSERPAKHRPNLVQVERPGDRGVRAARHGQAYRHR